MNARMGPADNSSHLLSTNWRGLGTAMSRNSAWNPWRNTCLWEGGGRHEAMVLVWLPLAAPIGLSPLLILTLCGSERVLVVSTEPPGDLSCLTTPGVGCPRDGAVARAADQGHPDAPSESVCVGGGGGLGGGSEEPNAGETPMQHGVPCDRGHPFRATPATRMAHLQCVVYATAYCALQGKGH